MSARTKRRANRLHPDGAATVTGKAGLSTLSCPVYYILAAALGLYILLVQQPLATHHSPFSSPAKRLFSILVPLFSPSFFYYSVIFPNFSVPPLICTTAPARQARWPHALPCFPCPAPHLHAANELGCIEAVVHPLYNSPTTSRQEITHQANFTPLDITTYPIHMSICLLLSQLRAPALYGYIQPCPLPVHLANTKLRGEGHCQPCNCRRVGALL